MTNPIPLKIRIIGRLLGISFLFLPLNPPRVFIRFSFLWKEKWIAEVYNEINKRVQLAPEIKLTLGYKVIRADFT